MSQRIDRGSLPQNFLDSVSNQALLLPTPQPQFTFAYWAMANRLSLAALNAGMSTAQQYVSMAGGGAPIPQEMDRLIRVADSMPGFVTAVDQFGLGRGDTIKFQRTVFNAATSGYTEESRVLGKAPIATNGQAVEAEEKPVVLREFTGPINKLGTAVEPYAIWDFDAKYKANKFQLASIVGLHLKNDYVRFLDTAIRDRFRNSSKYTTPGGVAASTMTAGSHGHDLDTWLEARKQISDRNWQPFPGGRYVALVNTTYNVQMSQDAGYTELSKNHPDRNILFGYISSVQDIDFYECVTLRTYAAGEVIPNEGSTVAANTSVYESLLIGPGAVGFGTGLEPEARFADDTNYGTVAKVIWYALHAFETLDERGIQRVLTS